MEPSLILDLWTLAGAGFTFIIQRLVLYHWVHLGGAVLLNNSHIACAESMFIDLVACQRLVRGPGY